MESHAPVRGEDAQAALDAAGDMAGRAQRRSQPPRWYLPSVCALVFAVFASQALPLVPRMALVVLAGLGVIALLGGYRVSTRINPWRVGVPHKRVPAMVAAAVVGGMLSLGTLALSQWTGQAWWCVVSGVLGVALVLMLEQSPTWTGFNE